MKKQNAKIDVIHSELEGECSILEAFGIKINNLKLCLFFVLAFLTGGVSLIVCYWEMKALRFLLFDFCNLEEATYVFIKNWDDTHSIRKLSTQVITEFIEDKNWSKRIINGKVFNNRYLDYILSEKQKKIIPMEFFVHGTMKEVISNLGNGLSDLEASEFLKVFDKCLLELPIPSIFLFALEEILNGYFLFQIFSCLVWYNNEYAFFASIILGTSIITAVWNLVTARINFNNVRNMAEYITNVEVLRNGQKKSEISSTELVPGDIILLKDNFKMPCDCILLKGDVLVNECSLTGESLPIMKKSIEAEEEGTPFDPYKNKINLLFEGTLILQSNNRETQQSMAIVLRTRFGSVKGQLVRSILYPKSHKFQFLIQSYKFVFIMALCTLVGFFAILNIFMEIFTPGEIILRLCDLVTISVPPSLPLAMNIGIRISLAKLWKNKIFCIAPKKILVAGNVNMICFDKTGTITEDYMDFGGLLTCKNGFFDNKIMLHDPQTDSNDEIYNYCVDCMATCHAIIRLRSDLAVKATEELFGDVMEMKIFEYTGAQFLDGKEENDFHTYIRRKNRVICIKKKFEFSSDLQRMSVLCQSNEFQKKRVLFMKGAPEVIKKLSRPDSIPDNFDGVLEEFTLKGLRVLAIGYREFDNENTDHVLRVDLEKDVSFVGFILLDNKLKSDSLDTFKHLNSAQIGCKMVTGDNPLTALSKAKECNIITNEKEVYICDIEEAYNMTKQLKMKKEIREVGSDKNSDSISILSKNHEEKDHLVNIAEKKLQKSAENDAKLTKQVNIEMIEINPPENSTHPIIDSFLVKARSISLKDSTFVFTGRAFEEIFQAECRSRKENGIFLGEVLSKAKVFARMKPSQKAVLVELLQKLDYTVAMVGDGANDCGALRQADVGLSLSEAEASISAPFTAKDLKVSSIITLLRYGRSGLICSFESFKYIALYSMIQFISQIILYSYYSTLSEPFFVYQDLFICVTLFSTMSLTDAAEVLSVDRITPSLFSLKCVASILGQTALQTASQVIMLFWLRSIPYYDGENGDLKLKNTFLGVTDSEEWVDGEEDPEPMAELDETGPISTTMFYLGIFLLVGGTLCFSIGRPYRKPFHSNLLYTFNIIVLYLCNYIFCFVNLDNVMVEKDNGLPVEFVGYTIMIAHIFMIAMFLYEKVIVNILITKWEARIIANERKKKTKSI